MKRNEKVVEEGNNPLQSNSPIQHWSNVKSKASPQKSSLMKTCRSNQVDLDVMVHILLSAGHETGRP